MKTRVISAIVATAIVLPLLLLGGYPFIFGVCLLAMLAYKEIIDLRKSHKELPLGVVSIGLVSLILLVLANIDGFTISFGLSYQRLLLITLVLIVPVVFYKKDKYTTKDAFYLLGIVIFLGLIFNMFIVLRMRGLALFIYLIMIPILTDTFAYLGGRAIGKHKMCPSISPNKTWEGAIVGLIAGAVGGTIIHSVFVSDFSINIIFISILLSIMGQIGDLVMSKIKRENDIKDFSNIMPGHGGILDRLDSLIFVVITYIVFIIFI